MCVCVCLSVKLSVCLSVCLSVRMTKFLSVHLSIYLSAPETVLLACEPEQVRTSVSTYTEESIYWCSCEYQNAKC